MSELEKNKGGRPTSYKEEYCEMLIDHMSQGLSYESFAGLISVCKQTLYDWEKVQPKFLDSKRLGIEKSRLFWEKTGIAGMFMGGPNNPFQATVWVFNMKNRFGWKNENSSSIDISEDQKKLIINLDTDE